MKNRDHISESLETIWVKIYLNSLIRIRDPGWKKFRSRIRGYGIEIIWIRDPGSGMARIRDLGSGIKHPGSATLEISSPILLGLKELNNNAISQGPKNWRIPGPNPLPLPLVMDMHASKTLCTGLYKSYVHK
jgi:hypothetical protein